jgi:serine/threonine protein kinase
MSRLRAFRTSGERWRRVDEILGLALAVPRAEQAALLARTCAGDIELLCEVESLLQADELAGDFLDPLAGSSTPRDLLNTVLAGRYRIDEHVGEGGMGAVYRARDLVLETDVAVKVLDRHLLARPGRMEAFRREVRLARRVTHPNVCRVHDIVEDGEVTFITMEYVEGESLAQRLERREEPALDWCLRVLADVARGLVAAHAAGVIHRDLKPANVLLRQGTDEAVVADFGVAAEAAGQGPPDAAQAGTHGYMAPEQAAGAPPSVRSDLFSFGVLAHRVIAGRLPGEGVTRELPPPWAGLVAACLQHEPEERPTDARTALRILERGAARRTPPRFLHRATALAAVAVALTGTLLWAPWRRGPRPDLGGFVLTAVDTSQLDPKESWLGDAFQRLVLNDLIDAWAVEARVVPSTPAPPRTAIRARLWRDAGGLLRASVVSPRRGVHEIQGGSLREAAEAASRLLVNDLVPAEARHPTAQELQEVGATDPEAWRQLRRARRAARMEHWERVRALARDATARDPGFCMAWLELDLTYNKEDQARRPILDKVVEHGDRAPGLSPLSRLGVEFARQSRRKDEAALRRVLAGFNSLELEGQDHLYIKTRLALASFTQGEPETGLPSFEWIAEKWPHDAAAPKKLADYYLGEGEPVSLALALRHGQNAVALAPDDVAARANLARGLLLSGEERTARGQLAVIAMADPDDKQSAFLGERTNRLFALHMALGEVEDAAVDARRLIREPGLRHAQGLAAQAAIDLSRGAFDEGLAKLAATAAAYEGLQLDALALSAHWQHAWQAYSLGRRQEAVATFERMRRLQPRLRESVGAKYVWRTAALAALARQEAGLLTTSPASVASARATLDHLPAQGEWLRWRAHIELLIRHHLKDWTGVVTAYRDLEVHAVPLATTYQAANALERLGRREEAVRLYEQLATHPNAWHQPYRRGQAWLRLGILRQESSDSDAARTAFESLLRLWDRAPRDTPEVREAERRLAALRGRR